NPLDCAKSNIESGHARLWQGAIQDERAVLDNVLGELAWFQDLARRHGTERFLSFFEFELDEALLGKLAEFLGLCPDARWNEETLGWYRVKGRYAHDPALLHWYEHRVRQLFAADETFARKLARFSR